MKHYFNNSKAREQLNTLFDEAALESKKEYSFFLQGDFYTALKIRNRFYGFIMVKMPAFDNAEIAYSFVTKEARRKGHYTEMLKGTRKQIIKRCDLNGERCGIKIKNPKIPYLHQCRGAEEHEGYMYYDLTGLRAVENMLMHNRPKIQTENRKSSDYEKIKKEAWGLVEAAPWSGGGWGYNPHQYTVRRNWEDRDEFFNLVEIIQHYGQRVKYGQEHYDVMYFDTHRVWNCSLIEHPFEVTIINRKPIAAP